MKSFSNNRTQFAKTPSSILQTDTRVKAHTHTHTSTWQLTAFQNQLMKSIVFPLQGVKDEIYEFNPGTQIRPAWSKSMKEQDEWREHRWSMN